MYNSVCYNDATSELFPINCGVKQGCVLSPTFFRIFFLLLLSYFFNKNEDRVYLRTRSEGRLFTPTKLRAKTKVRHVTIREAFFADNAALAIHTGSLQRLIDCFAHACDEFVLTIILKKTEVMKQGIDSP